MNPLIEPHVLLRSNVPSINKNLNDFFLSRQFHIKKQLIPKGVTFTRFLTRTRLRTMRNAHEKHNRKVAPCAPRALCHRAACTVWYIFLKLITYFEKLQIRALFSFKLTVLVSKLQINVHTWHLLAFYCKVPTHLRSFSKMQILSLVKIS